MNILFANEETLGAVNSMPVIRLLRERGEAVTVFSTPDCPAYSIYKSAGVNPTSFGLSSRGMCTTEAIRRIFEGNRPDVVVAGVSVFDSEPAKGGLCAAHELDIPSVLLLGAWPHLWLTNHGERDLPLYREVSRVLAFDEISRDHYIAQGFDSGNIRVTGAPDRDAMADLIAKRHELSAKFRRRFNVPPDAFVATYAVTNNLERGQLDVVEGDPRWFGFGESEVLEKFLKAMWWLGWSRRTAVFVRVKPGRERSPIQALISRHCQGAQIIGEECEDGRHAILGSNMVVGTTTIMLQDAAFLGVLPVCFYPRLTGGDPQFANTLGIILQLRGENAFRDLIACAAMDQQHLARMHETLKRIELPNNATEQVADAILAVAR